MNRNGTGMIHEETPAVSEYIKELAGYCIYRVWEWMIAGITCDILDMFFVQDENEVDALHDIHHEDHEFAYALYASILSDIQNEPIANK